MVRYTITLPTHDNDGHDLADVHEQAREYLLRHFGAFTAHEALGAWRGAERTYAEPVVAYAVDVPDTRESYASLHALAQALKASGGQEAIYLTRQPVDTWLV